MQKNIKMRTYCSVDSNALKFPSFPVDHLLTSASNDSANLCDHSWNNNQENSANSVDHIHSHHELILHFSLLAPFEQEYHAYSFRRELLPAKGNTDHQKTSMKTQFL